MKNIILATGLLLLAFAAQAQSSQADAYNIHFSYCRPYDSQNFCASDITDSSGRPVAGLAVKTLVKSINGAMNPARFEMMRMGRDGVDAIVNAKIQTREGQAVLVVKELIRIK